MNCLFNINVCRVCMQNAQNIYLNSDKDLLEKFEFTTRLQIAKEDNLPKAICSKCTARLKLAYNFIKTAHDSENNLKNFLEKINSEFKEVTQANKSCKIFSNGQNLAEDELLSLMAEEHQEEILTVIPLSNKNIKNCKPELEINNLNAINAQNLHEDNCKTETSYTLSADILLIDTPSEINNVYETNSHIIEIPSQIDEEKECFSKELEEDQELENNPTCTSIKMLESNDESEIRSESVELAIEDPEEIHDYDIIVNSQDDTIQCRSVYIDESSIEETNRKYTDDNYCVIKNSNDEDEDTHKEDESSEQRGIEIDTFPKRGSIHRFYCGKCDRDFSTKTNLNRHMQSHEGNKPFSCTECKKSFTQKSTLKQHMYTHTGERPYVCEVCNRGFTQCKSLIFHMRRHTGEKPFHCEYCLITFRQKDALRIHILKHHVVIERATDGTEIFSCIICQKKFETKNEFKTHMKNHTATGDTDNVVELFRDEDEKLTTTITKNLNRPKQFQCGKCFKCFALQKSLVRHVRIHYVKNDYLTECFDCNLRFSSTQGYQEHLSVYHQ